MMRSFETLAFYRGLKSDIPLDRPSLLRMRKDRKPRDTPEHLHSAADQWFFRSFGVPYRSQAVFLTPSRVIAQFYGKSPDHCVRVVPIGDYSFCWSKKYADFLHLAKDAKSPDVLVQRLSEAEYGISDLDSAHKSGNELMLYCETYIAIPVGLLGEADELAAASSLLVDGAGKFI